MNSILDPMTAQIPSGFAMPSSQEECGHAEDAFRGRSAMPVTAFASGAAGVVLGGAVRDRQGAIARTLGYAETPGTPAWRPPTS